LDSFVNDHIFGVTSKIGCLKIVCYFNSDGTTLNE